MTTGVTSGELISLYLDAVVRQDTTIVDRFFHPDIEYLVNGTALHEGATLPPTSEQSRHALPWLGVYRGREAVRQLLAHMHANLEVTAFGTRAVICAEDQAAAFGWFRLHALPTRGTVDIPFAIWLELRNGLISRYHFLEGTLDVALAFRDGGEWQVLTDGGQRTVPSA